MKSRLFCNRSTRSKPRISAFLLSGLLCSLGYAPAATAADAPSWMHALVNAPLPAHDEKTDAALLYSEKNLTVISADKIKTVVRRAYKILRPDGREYGSVVVPFNSPGQKVTS